MSGESFGSYDGAQTHARVNVTSLKNPDSSQVLKVASNGHFSASSLDKGEYLIEAVVPGYSSQPVKMTLPREEKVKLVIDKLDRPELSVAPIGQEEVQDRGAGKAVILPPGL